MKYLVILGRQPELSLAELESVLGPAKIKPLGPEACLVKQKVDISRFGGLMKVAKIITSTTAEDWSKVASQELSSIYRGQRMSGKLKFGLSSYGMRLSAKQLGRSGLKIKQSLRQAGISCRLIPNNQPSLNTAQIKFNKLLSTNGVELLIVKHGEEIYIAKTQQIQDIEWFTQRDRQKPIRDNVSGMLPPKVAMMLLNLAKPPAGGTVLDPFCGCGTVLMEALLQGFQAYGSDIAPKMVEASQKNIDWLAEHMNQKFKPTLEVADAQKHSWQTPFDTIACETYLGPPLRQEPSPAILKSMVENLDQLHRKFLLNLAPQLSRSQTIAIAVPAWYVKGKLIQLPLVDDLKKMGYNRSSFEHVHVELIYRRPSQIVARHILVLTRK